MLGLYSKLASLVTPYTFGKIKTLIVANSKKTSFDVFINSELFNISNDNGQTHSIKVKT